MGWGIPLHLFVSSHGQLIVEVVEESLAVGDANRQVDVCIKAVLVTVPLRVQALLVHHINLFANKQNSANN